jgi:hypothetical protein
MRPPMGKPVIGQQWLYQLLMDLLANVTRDRCWRRRLTSYLLMTKLKSGFDQINFTSTAELIEESHICKLPVVSVILAALLDNSFLSWEHSKARLTNNHVLKLAGSPLSESVVVGVIGVYDSEFDTSDGSLLTLKRNGVSDKLIAAMLSKELKATASGGSPLSLGA